MVVLLMAYLTFQPAANKDLRFYASAASIIIYVSKLLFILFVGIDDLRRLIRWLFKKYIQKPKPTPANATNMDGLTDRRTFLIKAGLAASVAPMILFTRGVYKGAYDYQVKKIPLHLAHLPSAFKGLKILQISDIHSGSWNDKDGVKKGIDLINAQQTDLIFFTGDLVNNKTDEVYEWMDLLAEIKAPMGILSTLGNHDYGNYYRWPSEEDKAQNMKAMFQVHADLGWHLMNNSHLTIDKNGQRIGIVGVENWGHSNRFPKLGDLQKAMKNMPDVPVKLLLSHDPSHWDLKVKTETPDIDVMFAGHTHGFQFGIENKYIKWSPAQWMYNQWAGLYQDGDQQLYVNRGFGFLGYPGRVGILPEITVFELL
jgi:predicted MPP superfamily phosphohydrolase